MTTAVDTATVQVEPIEREGLITAPTAVLVAGIAYGAVAQGAFYRDQVMVMALIVLAAGVLAVLRHSERLGQVVNPLTLMFLGIAASAVLSAWVARYPSGANGVVLVMLALVAAALVARTASPRQQEVLMTGVVVVAVVVAAVGLVAVLIHDPRLANPGLAAGEPMQIWRMSSTFTYPNSAAGFLILPTLVAASRVASSGASRLWRAAAFALLLGLVPTFSRGGLAGLTAGAIVLMLLGDWRALARFNWSIIAGAVVALVCLAPSLPTPAHPHLVLAGIGLAAGLGLSQVRSLRAARLALPALVLGGLVVSVVILASSAHDLASLTVIRLNSNSVFVREMAWVAAFDVFRGSPIVGIGPGHFVLPLDRYGIQGYVVFVHNEYLQLLAEQGLVGVGVLLIGMGAVVVNVLRSPRGEDWLWVGCAAGLAGLAVHSGVDFLWHVTVIIVAAAVAVSILTSDRPRIRGR